eukprot:12793800-Alexandrium_andersonii.AAC.1
MPMGKFKKKPLSWVFEHEPAYAWRLLVQAGAGVQPRQGQDMRSCVSRIKTQRDRLSSCVFLMRRSHARAPTLACPA